MGYGNNIVDSKVFVDSCHIFTVRSIEDVNTLVAGGNDSDKCISVIGRVCEVSVISGDALVDFENKLYFCEI